MNRADVVRYLNSLSDYEWTLVRAEVDAGKRSPPTVASAYGVASTYGVPDEQTEFDVILAVVTNRIQVVRVLRQGLLWSLKEAVEAASGPFPYTLARGMSRYEAEKLRDQLRDVGSVVVVR